MYVYQPRVFVYDFYASVCLCVCVKISTRQSSIVSSEMIVFKNLWQTLVLHQQTYIQTIDGHMLKIDFIT